MRDDAIAIVCVLFFAAAIGWYCYRIGYDQGRNDGFHQGWREAMQAKEVEKQ